MVAYTQMAVTSNSALFIFWLWML